MSGSYLFSQEYNPHDPGDHDHSVYDPDCWICEDRMMEARELSHELEKLYHADDEDYDAE